MKKRKEKAEPLDLTPPLSVIRGQQINATYTKQLLPEYQNNPVIEALPPLWTKSEVETMLSYFPYYNAEQREWPEEARLQVLENCREFFIPQGIHYEIHLSVSNMIRRSYISRNPVEYGNWAKLSEKIDQLNQSLRRRALLRSKARGLAIVGVGGVGKSTAVENILYQYPQVITHTSYKDKDLILKQLVWIKLDCPSDGSLKGLCLTYIQEVDDILGTNYMVFYGAKRCTGDELLLIMARIASIHYQGVIVLDEIQDLSESKSGGAARMLNFLVKMENTLGIPFIIIATPKARALFAGEFRQARRISEQGDIIWRPMREIAEKEEPNDKDEIDPDWNIFVRAMWEYWYLKKDHQLPENLLDDPAVEALYKQSQGITALVVTIFFLAQRRAITSGKEDITENVIRYAVKDNQYFVSQMLERLREGKLKPLGPRLISDLDLSDWQTREATPQQSKESKPPKRNKDNESKKASDSEQPNSTSSPGKSSKGRKSSKKASKAYDAGDFRNLASKLKEAGSNQQPPDTGDFAQADELV